jgi:hypothetical protein
MMSLEGNLKAIHPMSKEKGNPMDIEILKHQGISVRLTTLSPVSNYGFPILRVEGHPAGDEDCGPADTVPHTEDEPGGTAAALVCAIHERDHLTGAALEAARSFLSQWPDGPQILSSPTQ